MGTTGRLALFILALCLEAEASVPTVKVLIAKSLKNVVVEGMDLQKTIHTQKKALQYQGRKSISFNCNPSKERAALPKSPLLVASLRSPTGLVSWGNNKYQGELHLLTNPTKESCDLVNSIPMESYITTLLAKEMNGTWPVEALKAQAVAARTYAYDRLKKYANTPLEQDKLYHLESSEKDQVSGSFMDITENTLKASRETAGEILVGPSGKVAPAFFHSKCGGRTLRPDQVWGGVEEGYRSVDCTFCQKTGMKDWNHKIKNNQLTAMVDQVLKRYYSDGLQDKSIKVMPDSLENSEIRLYAGDRLHIVKKAYLRNLLGREVLPSNYFVMSMDGKEVKVEGQGYGHGVGLCQLGALELAKRGYDYRQILSHYFPRHKMRKAY
jgi:stage II sporulation protein D